MNSEDAGLQSFNRRMGLEQLDLDPKLQWIYIQHRVKPSFVMLSYALLVILLMIVAHVERLIVCVSCCIIPALFTFASLDDPHNRVKYLTYWPMFALMELSSPLFMWIHSVTLSLVLRLILTIWLLSPSFDGATKIFEMIIRPNLIQY